VLTLQFLNAKHGDSCLVQWAEPTRVLLVDGGPGVAYRTVLAERLRNLHRPIDAVCVSHLDDDHIGGILRLLRDNARAVKQQLPQPLPIRELWFNTLDQLLAATPPALTTQPDQGPNVTPGGSHDLSADDVIAASYRQGNQLRASAAELHLDQPTSFTGLLRQGSRTVLHGLDIRIIAPDDAALQNLRAAWLAATGPPDIAEATGASFDDRSVPNLSSIVMYLTYYGRTVLLTGDARGDTILSGLHAAGLLIDTQPAHVSVLKMPHHGSAHNIAPAFFNAINADHYIISADGTHGHPDLDTLRWLVASRAPEHRYTVHLTNHITSAVNELHHLQHGNSFTIAVRPHNADAITISM